MIGSVAVAMAEFWTSQQPMGMVTVKIRHFTRCLRLGNRDPEVEETLRDPYASSPEQKLSSKMRPPLSRWRVMREMDASEGKGE